MSNDHHSNGHNEKKSVAFTAPLILGAVTIFIILCFVSLGNPCHNKEMCCEDGKECSKECAEACEKGDHTKHPEQNEPGVSNSKEDAGTTSAEDAHIGSKNAETGDTTHTEPVKEEAHH